jgi:hypothetical protein
MAPASCVAVSTRHNLCHQPAAVLPPGNNCRVRSVSGGADSTASGWAISRLEAVNPVAGTRRLLLSAELEI